MNEHNEMRLPAGKTCADCAHFPRCTWLIRCEAGWTSCDWSPSRFIEQSAGSSAAPSLARLLKVYVLYERPRDHPQHYVVRVHYTRSDGSVEASPACAIFGSLREARAHCVSLGLALVPRAAEDDPVIVETWL